MNQARDVGSASHGRDVDAVATGTLALASAFLSFLGLEAAAAVAGPSTLSQLAPRQTLGRLWAFFVFVPAVIAFVGIAAPCLLRIALAALRSRLPQLDRDWTAAILAAIALVGIEAAVQRSGAVSLTVLGGICLYRLLRRERTATVPRLAWQAFGLASASVIGFAGHQQLVLAGEPASTAVAPTLFLVAFYGIALGAAVGGMYGVSHAAMRPLLSAAAGFATYLAWLGSPRALLALGAEVGRFEPHASVVAAILIAVAACGLKKSTAEIVDAES